MNFQKRKLGFLRRNLFPPVNSDKANIFVKSMKLSLWPILPVRSEICLSKLSVSVLSCGWTGWKQIST